MSPSFPSIWIQTKDDPKILICFYYRMWKDGNSTTSIDDQQSRLNTLLDQFHHASLVSKHLVAVGDMNIDANKLNDNAYHLKSISDMYRSFISSIGMELMPVGVGIKHTIIHISQLIHSHIHSLYSTYSTFSSFN